MLQNLVLLTPKFFAVEFGDGTGEEFAQIIFDYNLTVKDIHIKTKGKVYGEEIDAEDREEFGQEHGSVSGLQAESSISVS